MQLFENIQKELIDRIRDAKSSLKIAVTWFTNHDLFNEIYKKLENPNFNLNLIVLNDRINNKIQGVDFQKLIDANANFYFCSVENMVHHKFCIVDDLTVITGSYNWTYYAENRNWENIVVLNNKEIVNGYIQEFDRIIQAHEKIQIVSEKQSQSISINSNDYLQSDYIFQAQTEQNKGNDLNVAKIYTEILKLDRKQPAIIEARNEIVKKYNNQQFEVAPFEIGILYKNGYSMAIPAFECLPFTVIKSGRTPSPGISALQVTIQKNDYLKRNILQFTMENLKVCAEGTLKLEHSLTLNKNGILTVITKELNGYGRVKSHQVDIKNYL